EVWPMVLGAFAAGLALWFLTHTHGWLGVDACVSSALAWARRRLSNLVHSQGQQPVEKGVRPPENARGLTPFSTGCQAWGRYLTWGARLLIWSIWVVLCVLALEGSALGVGFVVVGLLLTLLVLRWPTKALFVLCLAANLVAAVALLT